MELRRLRDELRKYYEIKGNIIDQETRSIKFLGREITSTESGCTWKADPKHVNIFIQELGLEQANGVDVPVGTEERPDDDRTRQPMKP